MLLAISTALVGCAAGEDAREPNSPPAGQRSPAERLLDRAIEFHDPDRLCSTREVQLSWTGTESDGKERIALEISMHAGASRFAMSGRYKGTAIDYATVEDELTATVNGSAEFSPEESTSMRLDRENGMFWRDYFGFLVGLPMKLTDPGTHIDPDTADTEFNGRPVRSIRVTFDADVGGDTWYFYFDPETAELVGCRFFHDESKNDGEYIVFEGLVEASGLRLPRSRSWYMNADDRFLGTDVVANLTVSP